jgi:hypothetical protein
MGARWNRAIRDITACTNVACGEDRRRHDIKNEKVVFFILFCPWLALSLPAAKLGCGSEMLK